jgi:hypothetical protein
VTATSVTPAAGAPATPSRHHAGFGHLLLSEWTKIRSVRSTVWTLIVFVVVTVGFTALFSWLIESAWNNHTRAAAARDATVLHDPVAFVLGPGIHLGQLAICVLGVLLITTEYSSGLIRSSLLAVPKRLPMLAAKTLVFAAIVIVLAEIVTFASFYLGSAILHSKVATSLSEAGVTRAVIGTGLYLSVLGLFSLGIGGLIRHTAGAISTVIGVVLILPILAGLLPGSWGAHVNAYLPEQAGSLITDAHQTAGALLSPWEGFGVFCIWAALALIAAGWLLDRRDA